MRAMVLAAGLGTRLGALTQKTPKCLMPVGTSTLLELTIVGLKKAGVHQLCINLHYLGDQIENYIRSHDNFGLTVNFSKEPELLGTGGGIKAAKEFLDDGHPFFVHNSDIYTDLDLRALYEAHVDASAMATLAVMNRPTERPLLLNTKGELLGWENTKTGSREVVGPDSPISAVGFSGVQVISPSLFKYMEQQVGSFSSIRTYMDAAKAGERIGSFDMSQAYWIDAGTPERLAELRNRLGTKGQ